MKRLTCEMCGSTDLIKKEGVFECQTCGTKYSVEEAKKMMIEGTVEIAGTVDVKGTVKVDNTDIVKKYLQNARRAKDKEDWEETEKYYNMAEQYAPTNIEAIFYSAYAKAKNSLIVNDIFKREAVFKVLCNSVSIIDDNFNYTNGNDIDLLEQICQDVLSMANSTFVFTETTTTHNTDFGSFKTSNNDKGKTYKLFNDLYAALNESLVNIVMNYDESCVQEKIRVLEIAMTFIKQLNSKGFFGYRKDSVEYYNVITNLYKIAAKTDPTYKNSTRVLRISYENKKSLLPKTLAEFSLDGQTRQRITSWTHLTFHLVSEGKHRLSWFNPKSKKLIKAVIVNVGLEGTLIKAANINKKGIEVSIVKE